jgi:hypothetical protein
MLSRKVLYRWLVLLHIVTVVAFLMMHTVQIVISYFWPQFETAGETKVSDLLISSVRRPSFVALGAVFATGVLLVAVSPNWLSAGWIWISAVLLAALGFGKWLAAGKLIKADVRILGTVGIGGLLVLLWLMILKPF